MGPRPCSGLSSASLGGNADGGDAVQARKGGSPEGKISNSVAEALGSTARVRRSPGAGSCPTSLQVTWEKVEEMRPSSHHILLSSPPSGFRAHEDLSPQPADG